MSWFFVDFNNTPGADEDINMDIEVKMILIKALIGRR